MSSAAQPLPAKKLRKSRKAPAIQTAVIVRRAQGQDKTSISKELGIGRNTVTSILEENDVERQMQTLAAQSVDLIPEALRVARVRLAKDSESMAIETLRNTIWPLNGKNAKGMKAGDNLFLSIQNLIQPQTVSPVESTSNSVVIDTTLVKPTT